MLKVAIIGAGGYVGGELLRILAQHPDVGEWIATSRSKAGTPIAATHPALAPLTGATFSGDDPGAVSRGRDVVFLALEHGESSRMARTLFDARPGAVIDLSADFRTSDPALYRSHYGEHAAPDLLGRFTYALADVLGDRLRGKTALAAPGCFATAAQLALYPLATADLAGPPAMFAITGSSGAGAQPRPTTHHPMRAHNLFAYSVLSHRHEGEILERWRQWTGRSDAAARLMTHSGPFVRGIHLTLYARLRRAAASGEVARWYRDAFAGRPFVRVLDQPPELTHVVGTNYAQVYAAQSADGIELQVMVAIDNLVKGAGGQAVQAMNLALGLGEERGLGFAGVYPC